MELGSSVAVLDTDIGTDVDDILALTLMARSPELNLIGVTTVYGDTLTRARMAQYVCDQLKRPDVVVAAGERTPLSGESIWWAGHEGQAIRELDTIVLDESRSGVEYLCEVARAHQGRLDLFAIGPLTNIGKAIESDASFANSIHHLYIMGGAFWMDRPEHNIKSDARASDIVFRSGIPITAVGLDVTMRVLLRDSDMAMIEKALGEFGRVLSKQFHEWLAFMAEHGISTSGNTVTNPHDPLAVLSALRPDLFQFTHCDVEIDLSGSAVGRTRIVSNGTGRIRVASDVDAGAAEHALINLIAQGR